MSKVANAILVKSRAKYAWALSNEDYNQLLSCKSISQIASYLKKTHYTDTLEGVKETAISRGTLEALLRKKIYTDFSNLCRFERSIGEHYFEYLSIRYEVDYLLDFLRYYISGNPLRFVPISGDFFVKISKIEIQKLPTSQNYEDILKCLKNTDYYKLLLPFIPEDNKDLDFTTIEAVLDNYVYNQGLALFKEYFSPEEAKLLSYLIKLQAETQNIRRIFRIKKYYDNYSNDMLKALINSLGCYLTKKQVNNLINANNCDEVLEILNHTKYKKYLNDKNYNFIDEITYKSLFDFASKNMRSSTYPAVVMACAIVLFEIEVENLTNIIEGKRYNVDSGVIQSYLIKNTKEGE